MATEKNKKTVSFWSITKTEPAIEKWSEANLVIETKVQQVLEQFKWPETLLPIKQNVIDQVIQDVLAPSTDKTKPVFGTILNVLRKRFDPQELLVKGDPNEWTDEIKFIADVQAEYSQAVYRHEDDTLFSVPKLTK